MNTNEISDLLQIRDSENYSCFVCPIPKQKIIPMDIGINIKVKDGIKLSRILRVKLVNEKRELIREYALTNKGNGFYSSELSWVDKFINIIKRNRKVRNQ